MRARRSITRRRRMVQVRLSDGLRSRRDASECRACLIFAWRPMNTTRESSSVLFFPLLHNTNSSPTSTAMPSVTAFLIVALSAAGSAFALTFQGTEISGVTWEGGVQPTFLVRSPSTITVTSSDSLLQAYISTATDGLACVKACQATSGCSVARCVYGLHKRTCADNNRSYQSNLCIHYKANAAVAAIADPDSAPNPIFFAIPGECQGGLPDSACSALHHSSVEGTDVDTQQRTPPTPTRTLPAPSTPIRPHLAPTLASD